jgi:uncharacterized protein YjbI with pentapeptide repeats
MLKQPLFAALAIVALAAPALAQPITSEAERARTVDSVKQGRQSCANCDLFQAEFSYLELSNRNFSGARLRQADLDIASFNNVRFNGADLSVVNAFGARFTAASFVGANLAQGNFVGAHFESANLARARLDGAIFSGADLSEARGLTQAQLNRACGDAATRLPAGLTIPACRSIGATP